MQNKKDVKFTTLLDEKTYERLRKEAYNRHVSISWIIRLALQQLFLRNDIHKFIEEKKNEKSDSS